MEAHGAPYAPLALPAGDAPHAAPGRVSRMLVLVPERRRLRATPLHTCTLPARPTASACCLQSAPRPRDGFGTKLAPRGVLAVQPSPRGHHAISRAYRRCRTPGRARRVRCLVEPGAADAGYGQ